MGLFLKAPFAVCEYCLVLPKPLCGMLRELPDWGDIGAKSVRKHDKTLLLATIWTNICPAKCLENQFMLYHGVRLLMREPNTRQLTIWLDPFCNKKIVCTCADAAFYREKIRNDVCWLACRLAIF